MRVPTRKRPAGRGSSASAEHDRIVSKQAEAKAEVESERQPEERKPVKPFSISWVKPVGEHPLNAVFYGEAGHGKTTLATTSLDVPEMRDVLFIDAESGDLSIASRRDLDVVKVRKYDDIARVFDYLVRHCVWRDEGNVEKLLQMEKILKDDLVPINQQTAPVDATRTWFEEQRLRTGRGMDEPFLYRTVIVDTLSEVHKYLIYKFTGIEIGKTKINEDIEKMEEWQEAQELFRLFIRSFRDLPMNVLFVCAHEIEPDRLTLGKTEGGGSKRNPNAGKASLKLPGKASSEVPGFLDLVGYLVKEEPQEEGGRTHRYLYLGAGYEGWISKHRFENLPDLDYLTDPTMSSLLELARKDASIGTSEKDRGPSPERITPSGNGTGAVSTKRRSVSRTARAGSGSRTGRGSGGNGVRRGR